MLKLPRIPSIRWLDVTVDSRRDFYLVFVLLLNVLTWFYMTLMIIDRVPVDPLVGSAFRVVFYIGTIGSSLAGSILSEKISRLNMFYLWMSLGVVSSSLLTFAHYAPDVSSYLSIIFLLLGISFGLGMPSSLAHLADFSSTENRGRISAVIFCAVNVSTLPLAVLFMTLDLTTNAIILALWRTLGFVAFITLRPRGEKLVEERKHVLLTSIVRERPVFLYLLPWLMFNLIDAFEKPVLGGLFGPDFLSLLYATEPIIASFSILIAGWLCDRIGRKRVVLYGFVSLGIAYAMIGTAPWLQPIWYFYLVIDGTATGILWITFILILWGDLSRKEGREKYYVVGSVPFFARQIILLLTTPLMSVVGPEASFSLASFFLFLSVLPLMYAPETLPEKKIELRRLRSYVEQAKKLTQKHAK